MNWKREDVVVRYLLERGLGETAEVAVRFEDGNTWSRHDAVLSAYRAADRLVAQGVGFGDRVAVMLDNGPGFLRAWWGTTMLGAIMVACNTSWKGTMLRETLARVSPTAVITDADSAERVRAVAPGQAIIDVAELEQGEARQPALERPIDPWDIHHIQFTSGTEGPAKGSRNTYLHFFLTGSWATVDVGLTEQDTFLIDLPLFHQAALCMLSCCLATRSTIAVRSRPALREYWEVARDSGATISFLLSTMTPFLLAQPERPAEREHRLRLMIAAPLPDDLDAFQERFGIAELITAYGSTESGGPLVRIPPAPLVAGSCGQRRTGYEVRLVDEHDHEVPRGQPGELVVRSDRAWMLSTGYVNDPDGTARAWRNGWLHTGDVLREDDDGNFYFVDRAKDVLRRRGENVSSFEVERDVGSHPAVDEVACVPVPSDDGVDDEIKVFLVLQPGATIDFPQMVRFLAERMPHYMVPRFYEVASELPKTPSMRVRKHVLRERGNSESTWDAVASGLRVTRTGVRETAPLR